MFFNFAVMAAMLSAGNYHLKEAFSTHKTSDLVFCLWFFLLAGGNFVCFLDDFKKFWLSPM